MFDAPPPSPVTRTIALGRLSKSEFVAAFAVKELAEPAKVEEEEWTEWWTCPRCAGFGPVWSPACSVHSVFLYRRSNGLLAPNLPGQIGMGVSIRAIMRSASLSGLASLLGVAAAAAVAVAAFYYICSWLPSTALSYLPLF